MTPYEFIEKWRASELKERSAAQEHFIDLCRLLDEPTPAEADPTGELYCFERGARKDAGGDGWADVWKCHHFAWEYKGKRANLDAAFIQLRQYALALENPPLLIVSDMLRFRIHTNWTNSVSRVHEFGLDDLADAAVRDKLKWALSDPERLRPGETRQALTERAAAAFASLAHGLRERGHDPQVVAHFVNRLVFCMFAEDVGLLPNGMFTRMLEHARRQPMKRLPSLPATCSARWPPAAGSAFEEVAWFDGGLFDDDSALSLEKAEIETVLATADLDWSEIDPSILGTLFERGLDPRKRAQLGAHYTDRDKIMLIVEPVIVRPWLAEWETAKAEIAACLERAAAARSRAAQNRHYGQAERLLRDFLERLRGFRVLDPACGSGNFLYLALHALKDLEHRVQLEADAMGLPLTFPEIGPASVKGIEINPYAAELARVSVWIGEIQWMRRNGFSESRKPILKPLDTIECRDAISTVDGEEPDWPEADVVIGNPPFLGGKLLRGVLGGEYVEALQRLYRDRIHGEADLVCHWFDKAERYGRKRQDCAGRSGRDQLDPRRTQPFRAGPDSRARRDLRRMVGRALGSGRRGGAGVACLLWERASRAVRASGRTGRAAHQFRPDRSGRSHARGPLAAENAGAAFMGDTKNGAFDIAGDLAREWLRLPANPNGRPNADVLKPWVNGMDLTRRPAGKWIIDFGSDYERRTMPRSTKRRSLMDRGTRLPGELRQGNRRRAESAEYLVATCANPGPNMWQALEGNLTRYIATPTRRQAPAVCVATIRLCLSRQHQLIVPLPATTTPRSASYTAGFMKSWSLQAGHKPR